MHMVIYHEIRSVTIEALDNLSNEKGYKEIITLEKTLALALSIGMQYLRNLELKLRNTSSSRNEHFKNKIYDLDGKL